MPRLDAQLTTDRASRYLVQFCRHAAAMGGRAHPAPAHRHAPTTGMQVVAEWSSTEGTVTFGSWGRCTLTAAEDTLTLLITAPEEEGLDRIREIVTRDFARFTRRSPAPLMWRTPEGGGAPAAASAEPARVERRHPHLRTVWLVLALVAVAALHLGLAGTLVARSPWTGVATDLLLALVVVKVAVIGLVRVRLRRARTARAGAGGER